MIIYEDEKCKIEKSDSSIKVWNKPPYSLLESMLHWNKIDRERSKRDDCTLCETVTMNEDGEDYLVRMRCSEHSGN